MKYIGQITTIDSQPFIVSSERDLSVFVNLITGDMGRQNWCVSKINILLLLFFVYFFSILFWWLGVIVFDTIFNNISVISRSSVLLVDETGVPEENHRQVIDKLYHIMNVVSSTPRLSMIRTHKCNGDQHWMHMIGSCQITELPYNYHHVLVDDFRVKK